MVTAMVTPNGDLAGGALLDADACYRALQTRDPRFDGRLFVGVRTTGIYCRPICPARTPKRENCTFFASAAAAQEAGFRPCLRCRPEKSPDLATWRGTSNTVSRALALIAEGALDGDAASVERLAERVGVGERQLRRLFREHLGASPVSVAQTRRVLFAKQLVHETRMTMTQVALASGFGSVRRFNETFRALYRRPPRELRRGAARFAEDAGAPGSGIVLTLSYEPPYDWDAMLEFLSFRAIRGMEQVAGGVYRRTVAIGDAHGTIAVARRPGAHALAATIRFPRVETLWLIVARIRRVFDLGADVSTIGAHLAQDPVLAPLLAARPGLRVPGGWDGFELAVRAILGQQISVGGARTLAARLVERYGEPLHGSDPGDALRFVFPTPERLAGADLASLGMPRTRAAALGALARAAADDPRLFGTAQSLDAAIARLRALPGVGEWTAQYIALRALREPDAFPAADVGLLRALCDAQGRRPTPLALLARAGAWRPWRAYAAQHLWTHDAPALSSARARSRTIEEIDDGTRTRSGTEQIAASSRPRRDADRRPLAAAGR